MKKFNRVVTLAVVATSGLCAADITIDTYGYLGAIWNQEFSGNKDSTIAFTARAGADFYLNNGISFGLGAAGAWAAYDKNGRSFAGLNDAYASSSSSVYPNTGDVSDAYFKYTADRWVVAVGRYNANFLGFDWLSGNTQGVGFKYKDLGIKNLDLWVTYYNSVLVTGYQSGRIGSEMGTFYAYHPGARNVFIGRNGANVFAGGVNMTFFDKFIIDPFVLFNTSLADTNNLLFQVGVKLGYSTGIVKDWHSNTLVRAMLQYADQNLNKGEWNWMLGNDDNAGFLIWGDQEFKYQDWVKFGLGLYYVGGQGIWHTNDNSRFYGNWVNSYALNTFESNMFSIYLFGSFELLEKKLGFDLLAAAGDYTEISAVLRYQVWKQANMKADVGVGYVYNVVDTDYGRANNVRLYKGGHLLVFTKLAY